MPSLPFGHEELIRAYRSETDKLRGYLERYQSGGTRIAESKLGSPWIDVTDREIKSLMNEIAGYEHTIKRLEKEANDP